MVLKDQINVPSKRGLPVYSTNPSLDGAVRPKGRKVVGNDKQGMVIDQSTGEVLGHGGAMIYRWQEVDNEKFVKVYLAGLKQAIGLSKAGLAVFEIVYNQLQGTKDKDQINIGYDFLKMTIPNFSAARTSHNRGIRDLLEKGFLFQTPADGIYFVNIQYMFNGDRLAFVTGYYRKGTPNPMAQARQLDLLTDRGEEPK